MGRGSNGSPLSDVSHGSRSTAIDPWPTTFIAPELQQFSSNNRQLIMLIKVSVARRWIFIMPASSSVRHFSAFNARWVIAAHSNHVYPELIFLHAILYWCKVLSITFSRYEKIDTAMLSSVIHGQMSSRSYGSWVIFNDLFPALKVAELCSAIAAFG